MLIDKHWVIALHVPSLCLFGCLCLFVLGLVPFWALGSFFFLLFCGLLEFLRLKAVVNTMV